MKPLHLIKLLLGAALCMGLLACSTTAAPPVQLFDLGQAPALATPPAAQTGRIPAVSLADISASPALDSNYMLYRLQYENGQQPRSYAQHRWNMPPAQLLTQRLKMRVAGAGGVIVSATDGVANLPLLKIDLDDFSQLFSSANDSVANVSVRASVFKGRHLVAQQSFRQQAAAGPDAPAGARAMAAASDALIDNIILWLQGLPLN
ncbi:ABC-type transport auxiliary lipoprotein family protein [Undibacterium sp.]|jgi:cholesterol transport system auxiliary component|uniref:ABC-type transport auxiliary lipoprotein family protein n=1 Tax=Undibacterium sp. TaxID=1914977 RepID=UPI002BACB225|nr:ABC-type transport auxiliary lipoprotein family protein [Undibacterium sp.]HTD05986.1 ABC-type transport auxiliary lipoprotein family protein [Undibacterium sp.]